MKRIFLSMFAALPVLAVLAGCEKDKGGNSGGSDGDNVTNTSHTVTVLYDDANRHQEIDGFGANWGLWANAMYCHPQREQAMEDIFGDAGLRFNLYRGEVCNTYFHGSSATDRNWNFRVDDDWNLASAPQNYQALVDKYKGEYGDNYDFPDDIIQEYANLWCMDWLVQKGYAKDIYFMYSVWSPPAVWKESQSGGSTSELSGSFNMDYADEFADFLASFVKAFNDKFGVQIHGISGWNEPDQAMGGWDGCQWTYEDMTDFCIGSLRKQLENKNVNDTKIVFGELPWWNNSCAWMKDAYDYNNEIASQSANIIAAGHAYSSNIKNLNTMPVEVTGENNTQNHVWLTETCDDKKNEGELWSDGMTWAENYQSYLMNANVNAVLWWAAMRACSSTGENLLETNYTSYPDATTYFKTQRYYTIGHFSRYIPRGAWRYTVDSPNVGKDGKQQVATDPNDKNNRINGDVTFSSYVWTDENGKENYTIVIVNPSGKYSFETYVEVEGKTIATMTSVTSTENVKWNEKEISATPEGRFWASVPKNGVVTLTGQLAD